MNTRTPTYKRHRFPPDIIPYAVWLYFRFNLGHRDIEELLAQRGIEVSRASILSLVNTYPRGPIGEGIQRGARVRQPLAIRIGGEARPHVAARRLSP